MCNVHIVNNSLFLLSQVGSIPTEVIQLSSTMRYCKNLHQLIMSVYPRLSMEGTISTLFLTEHTILAPRNDDVNAINNATLEQYPGEIFEYFAADKVLDQDA